MVADSEAEVRSKRSDCRGYTRVVFHLCNLTSYLCNSLQAYEPEHEHWHGQETAAHEQDRKQLSGNSINIECGNGRCQRDYPAGGPSRTPRSAADRDALLPLA